MAFCQPPAAPRSINFTLQSKCNHNAINRAALLHRVKFCAALQLSRQNQSVKHSVEFRTRQNCIIASQNFCRVAAFFARPCSIDHAALQKINGQKMKKTVQNQHFSPHRGKSSPHRGKSSPCGHTKLAGAHSLTQVGSKAHLEVYACIAVHILEVIKLGFVLHAAIMEVE